MLRSFLATNPRPRADCFALLDHAPFISPPPILYSCFTLQNHAALLLSPFQP